MSGDRPLSRQEAEIAATKAWSAYAALLRTEAADPDLRTNPYWEPLRDTAYARFRSLYECEALK